MDGINLVEVEELTGEWSREIQQAQGEEREEDMYGEGSG